MFRVTYDIVTYESAEHGDVEEMGFVQPGGWRTEDDTDAGMSLREAVALMDCVEDAGNWFVECDGREDYRTGAVERRSLHPPRNVTPASYDRLKRLLKAR
jgi:hypothetical protein